MKGLHGLALAVVLGLAGAALNWFYLSNKGRDTEKVAFVGIAADTDVDRGQRLEEANLVKVEIPKQWVGNLEEFAILYQDKQTVIGSPVWRERPGGSLLLRQDLKTPPPELKFGKDERVLWVPVDSRTFVPALVEPGDKVTFITTPSAFGYPTPAEEPDLEVDPAAEPLMPAPALAAATIDQIGPFEVLALGNRLGSSDVHRASGGRQFQENVMAIRLKVDANGDLAPDAEKLLRLLHETNWRPMGILLHSREEGP